MQNQELAQTYLSWKQPSHNRHLTLNETKNNNWQRDETSLQSNNYFSEQAQVIQTILGYPVIQVIFDEQGDIILDIGDLITYQAVERAIKANVFNRLLEAAYIKK